MGSDENVTSVVITVVIMIVMRNVTSVVITVVMISLIVMRNVSSVEIWMVMMKMFAHQDQQHQDHLQQIDCSHFSRNSSRQRKFLHESLFSAHHNLFTMYHQGSIT